MAEQSRQETLSDVAARRVAEFRKGRGWSVERFASECAAAGAPQFTASVLTNIETGRRDKDGRRRRDVTVDEWAVLAYVLDVPPVLLLAPVGTDTQPSVLPGVDLRPYELHQWLTGNARTVMRRPDSPERVRHWMEAERPVLRRGRLDRMQLRLDQARGKVRRSEWVGDPEASLRLVRAQYVDILAEWAKALTELREVGEELPAYPPQLEEEARELGFFDADPAPNYVDFSTAATGGGPSAAKRVELEAMLEEGDDDG